ncbi:MAG: hypothetical protein JXR16_16295 [Bermanella sp.]
MAYVWVISHYFHMSVILCLLPIMAVQGLYLKKLREHGFVFSRLRQWQFYNGKARLKHSGEWMNVAVRAHQVWPLCVILQYRQQVSSPLQNSAPWHWDIIMKDACDTEHHRQLVALMRSDYQTKEA